MITLLCESLEILEEPSAKSSMIWIVGHYAERISNSLELLTDFVTTFSDEAYEVQLSLLTASVKFFLKNPKEGQSLITSVLSKATEESNPDVRERGFIYWRILNGDPSFAKNAILCDNHLSTYESESERMDPLILEELLLNIGNLSTVVQRSFKTCAIRAEEPTMKEEREVVVKKEEVNLLNLSNMSISVPEQQTQSSVTEKKSPVLEDLLSSHIDFTSPVDTIISSEMVLINAQGVRVMGRLNRKSKQFYLYLTIENLTMQTLRDLQFFIDKNRC